MPIVCRNLDYGRIFGTESRLFNEFMPVNSMLVPLKPTIIKLFRVRKRLEIHQAIIIGCDKPTESDLLTDFISDGLFIKDI
ncbi:MAG: hypothetical protein A2511_00165 [Deltaproteobacteria bacterium RIFOXYD12_FULL_50_9]|nr:MAG: hypothetical protein A2511_00165 [Deltaproteobacteria bacterium RIFOXYD12_FULL_50_9]